MVKQKKKLKPFAKTFLIIGVVFGFVLLTFGNICLTACITYYRTNNDPLHIEPTSDDGLVFANGTSLYDANGDLLRLKGCNVGGLLNTEGWMSPYSCGPLEDEHGNPISYGGYIAYPTLSEDEAREGLASNPNLTNEQKQEVVNTFRSNWFSDEDFARCKNDFQFNSLRLPVYWGELMKYEDGQFVLKNENDAFAYLDYFMQKCLDNNLYCIFDLHATPVTQSGYEHSGHTTDNKDELLWYSEKGIEATVRLWTFIANHYKNSELGKAIATYDLINEPSSTPQKELHKSKDRYTVAECYPVFDRIYKAIRGTGDNHVITFNFVWTYWQFPDPKSYGWENIQYEIHLYNNDRETYPWGLMMYGFEFTRLFHDWKVPYYVGEFTGYENEEDWLYLLKYFDVRGYSWNFWTYKKTVVGSWTDSWGLYNHCYNFSYNDQKQKVNLTTSTYEELISALRKTNTNNCRMSLTGQVIQRYLSNN